MRAQLTNAAIVAGLMIVAALALPWLGSIGLIAGGKAEMATRAFNLTLGLLVMGMANVAPKQLKPLAEAVCGPEREQAARRFAGVVIMAGGLGYALAWVAAPIGLALPLSIAALAGALALVLAQCAYLAARRRAPNTNSI